MSIKDIREPDRSPAYYIRVEGLDVVYGTVTPPTVTETVGGVPVTLASRASIKPDGFSFNRRLVAEDAIIESDPITVTLMTDEESADVHDPGNVFGRLGIHAADALSQLRTDIGPGDDVVTVEVSTTTGFAVDDVVHIGREACLVTEVLAGPPRLTLGERGVLGTRRQAHRVDAGSGLYPQITKPVVYFRGRRVSVYEAGLGLDGTPPQASSWIERMLGIIVSEPGIAVDGRAQAITLEIAPITSLLDQPLGTGRGVLRLAQDVHTFDGQACNFLDFGELVEEGDLLKTRVTLLPDNPGEQTADTASCDPTDLQKVAALAAGLPANHPRSMPVMVHVTSPTHITGFDAAANEITFDRECGFDLLTQGWMDNLSASERRRISMNDDQDTPLTEAWPDVVADRLQASLSSEFISGADGGRFKIELDLASEVAPAFIISANYRQGSIYRHPAATCVLTNDFRKLMDKLRVGQEEWAGGHVWDANGISPLGDVDFSSLYLPKEAISLDAPEGQEGAGEPQAIKIKIEDDDASDAVKLAPTKIASAFYFLGVYSEVNDGHYYHEKYITLATDPGVINTEAYEITEDDEDEPLARIEIGPAVEVDMGDHKVYRCPVESVEVFGESNIIADHRGESQHRLRPVATFQDQPIGVILLQLLCSLDGAGVTSALYDVLPFGAGIQEADIDVDSFLAIPRPLIGEASLSPIARQDGTIYETVRGLLRAAGYSIDLRPASDGKCRLTATPFGIPNRAETLDYFSESDIADSPTPSSVAELAIRNVFNFKANYDHEQEPKIEKTVRDTVSIEAFGEASEMNIELHGAVLRDDTPGQIIEALRPCFSRLRQEFAYPRRVFDVTVRAGLAAQLKIGGTYALTHRQLRGVKGLGVENALCRLRSVDGGGFEPTARCEFVHYGWAGSGWAPSAQVKNIAGAVLTLADKEHSPAADPVTGADLLDVDGFFVEGAEVRIHPAGDMDNFEVRKINSVDRAARQITLSQACAIGAPQVGVIWAWVAPVLYDDAPAAHQVYGFFEKVRVT